MFLSARCGFAKPGSKKPNLEIVRHRSFFTKSKSRFGRYELVEPVPGAVAPRRPVPEHIPRPDYHLSGAVTDAPLEPEVKGAEEIGRMRASCRLAARVLSGVARCVRVGATTDDVDAAAHALIVAAGAYPSPLNYRRFPRSVCTSVNNVACHGIPDARPLADGDIVNVDVTVFYDGCHGDCSRTFLVGDVDGPGRALVAATDACLREGIAACAPGRPLSAIGRRVERTARSHGVCVVPCFVGHGIGRYFHGPPDIYHFANRQPGVMRAGMTFTVEPVLAQGEPEVVVLGDGWTAVTADGSRAAQAEHTVLITDGGVEILTLDE